MIEHIPKQDTYKLECVGCGKSYQTDKRRGRRINQYSDEKRHKYLTEYRCMECRRKAPFTQHTSKPKPKPNRPKIEVSLVGMEEKVEEIRLLVEYGNKGIFLGGYHGLGKTTMVYDVAKFYKAEVIRLQVTELLTEIDILGSVSLKTGEFIYSQFVMKILEAIQNPDKKYFVLLDEFTRGREEALNVLFPVLAEKTLYINSPYSKHKVIQLTDNIQVFGTGNVKDRGLRAVGEAEFDRWSGVEVLPIREEEVLYKMIGNADLTRDIERDLVEFYLESWENGEQMRILPMSHRTLIEAANVTKKMVENEDMEQKDAVAKALRLTYYVSSQAILNPNYKKTYEDMEREVL